MSIPMTKIAGTHDNAEAKPGMAFFSGTGPFGATCGDCKSCGYRRESSVGRWNERLQQEVRRSYAVKKCAVFKKLTGQHGSDIENDYPACKYFEQAPKS